MIFPTLQIKKQTNKKTEAPLMVQWLGLQAPSAGAQVPGEGTRFHMLPLRIHILQLKICMPQ